MYNLSAYGVQLLLPILIKGKFKSLKNIYIRNQ